MTVQWTVRAANDRSRDRAARVKSHLQLQKTLVPKNESFCFTVSSSAAKIVAPKLPLQLFRITPQRINAVKLC